MRSHCKVAVTAVALFALLATACGGSDGSSSAASSTSGSTTRPASCSGTGATPHRDLHYGSTPGVAANLQSLDLYLPVVPKGCPAAPLVVYVHGGGFRRGDKSNKLTDKIDLFTKEGWGFASLNYRLVGDPGSGTTNGTYPAAAQDVAAGVAFLAEHADEHHLDARRIMLLGHSAGAHLVALLSTDGSFLEQAGVPLEDVVCTAPLDTTYDIPTQVARGGVNAQMYRAAFGADPAVWTKGSPSRNVAAGTGIPSFHVVTRGSPSRVAQAESFAGLLRDADVTADVQHAAPLTHEEVNAAVGQPGETLVTPALMAFYRTCVARSQPRP